MSERGWAQEPGKRGGWAAVAVRPRAWLALALAPALLLAAAASPSAAQAPPPPSGQFQAHQVDERGGIPIIQLTGSYDTALGGQPNAEPRAVVAQEFFRTHPDDFDFLVVIPNFAFQSGDGVAFHWQVRSSVQGIGQPPYDYGSGYGSPARLLGFLDLQALSQMQTDPLHPEFEATLNAFAHELMHQWGVYVHLKKPDGTLSTELLGLAQAHWSFLVDTRASVMYGNQWQDDGGGSFSSIAVRRFYSPLDLYLAGFYDASEVPPFLVITSPGTDPAQLPLLGATVTGTGRMVSVNDIIAAEGPRVPAAAQAQHAFKAAFVFLVRPGDVVTDDQLAAIDRVRREAMTHFSVLTGGRGTLDIATEPLPPAPGTPPPVQGGPLRQTAASLGDALTWLRGRQAADGSWQDTPSTQPRDSAVVFSTLAALDPLFTPPGQRLALSWLGAQAGNNTDDLARLATALDSAPLRGRLLAQANADGGWGLGPGYGSDPLDTALAVLAMAGKPDAPAAALAAASRFLIANQVPGAGWGNVLGGASRTGATALALEALRSLNATAANPAPLATALAWLAGKQNADGGFGDSPSTAHDTAAALLAAVDLGQGGAIRAGDATTYLTTHQSTEGSWEGSTFTTASVVAAIDRSSLPNWTFSGPLVATPAQPTDGDRVAIAMTVLSNGDVGAPAGVLRVYDGDPAAGGTPIGADLAIPPLGAGQTAGLTVTWDTLGKAGSHTLVAVIDPDGRVAELSKTDNRAAIAVTVAAAPAGVDLEVRSGDITVTPPHPSTLPVQLAISAVVRNNGQTSVPAADVRLYLGTPPAATVLGDVTVAVPGRSSAVANFVYTLTTPGTTVLTVVADPDNLIPEGDKTNNSASVSVTTAANFDLGLSSSDIQLAGAAYLGNDATFHVTLHNFGTVDSPSAQVRYTVTDGTTTRNLPGSTVAIAAGGTAQETVVWRVDLTGSLTFTVEIGVTDANPANNKASLAFTASAASVPNLVIGRGDLTLAPNPGLQGQPLTATAVVHNTGGQGVANVQVGLYDGNPAQGGALIGGALLAVPSLPAGGSATVAATLASIPDANDHLIYAVADPNNQVSELTKDDNSTFLVLPVLSLPDAAITQGSLVLQPAFPAPGQAVTLTVAVANLGQQPIPALLVRAYDGDPAQGGAAVGDQTIALPGSGGAQAVIRWTLGGASGPRTLFVVLDPNHAVVEASKANNSASLAIVVQQGDFTVSNRYFSPNGDGVQDTTELDFRLSGPMTVSIQAVDVHGNVVRTAAGAGYTNVAGGSFVWDGKDDLGRVVGDGDYVLRVVAADGTAQGQAVATVDTDRSPLFAALGTPFANFVNLTCQIPFVAGPFFYSDDEQAIFFLENGSPPDPIFGTGVYQMAPAGGSAQQLVPTFWFGGSRPSQLVASADGSRLAFDAYPPGVPASCPPSAAGQPPTVPTLWTVPSDGSTLPVALGCGYATLVGFDASGQNVIVNDGQSILALPVAGGAPRTVFAPPGGISYSVLSPDRQLLTVTGTTIVDLATGVATPIAVTGTASSFAWSPDSQHLALTVDTSVVVVGRDGVVRQTFAMPADVSDLPPGFFPNPLPGGSGPAPTLDVPRWSSDGSELSVLLDYNGCSGFVGGIFGYIWSRVVAADLATGTVQTVALGQPQPNGCDSFHVATWDGKSWAERGVMHYDARRRERGLDLDRFLPDARGEYRVRIRQTGYGEAHVDSVALFSGANRQSPTAAVRLADGKDVRAEVAAHDHRGIDLHDAEMEVLWKDVLHGRVRLALAATEGRPEDFAVPGVASPRRRGASAAGRPGSRLADRSASGQVPDPALLPPIFSGHVFWAPYQRQLAVSDLSTHAIDLDAGNLVTTIQAFGRDIFIDGFSPVGRYMELGLFGPDPPSTACYQAYGHKWAMRSLMNLTADLRVRQTPGVSGYLLEGTAADLHFARYQLDYANAANPGAWTPIAPPSTTPVLDSEFTTWVPPGPGSYLVRLTVQDLAGNSRTAVRRVSSSDSPSITDLSLTPRYFSPNGDGVLDTATIHYRVLQPVHLDFRFFDGAGNVVRTISQDHSEIGSSFDVVWDGRGDDGKVVPDGDYTVKVLGYELFVTVDTKPPDVSLGLLPARQCFRAIDPVSHTLVLAAFFAPSLEVKISDENGLATQAIETGVGAAPFTWLPALSGGLSEAQFDNHSFRASATDVAGNTTVRQVPPGPEQLFLTGLDTKAIDSKTGQLKPLPLFQCSAIPPILLPEAVTRMQVGESITAPISQLFVETQAAPLLTDGKPDYDPYHLPLAGWKPEAITAFYALGSNAPLTAIPESRFEIDWDLRNVVPGTATAARLHAVDGAGGDHWSDPFYVLAAGVAVTNFLSSGSPRDVGDAVANLLQQQGLAPPQDAVLLGLNFSSQALANVTLVMSSDQDPNFQAPRFYTPVASDGANYVFTSPDWRPCIKYRAHLVAQTAPQIDPATGEAVTLTFVTDDLAVERPCFRLDVTVEPLPPENPACDTNLGTKRTLVMTPFSLDGTTLQLLSVTGSGGVLFSVSGPASGTQYRYSLDLAGQPAGTLPLVAHITNTIGKEWAVPVNLFVETAPPVVAITSPQPGQSFCHQVEIDGTVDDAGCASFSLDNPPPPPSIFSFGGQPRCQQPPHYQGKIDTLKGDRTVTTRIVATNRGGFTACSAPLTVNFANAVQGGLSAVPWQLSPNGDGVADTTTLSFAATEPSQVGIVIQPAREVDIGINKFCFEYGVPVRTLAAGMPLTAPADAGTVTWDGKGDDGSVVPDGMYKAIATYQDTCGSQFIAGACLQVDTTPPQLAIDYPHSGDPLALVVEVRGLVTDAVSGVQGWSVEYGVGSDPQTWAGIAGGNNFVRHDFLGAWNTFGLSGAYTLRLRAVDIVGNASEVRVPLTLAQRVQLITSLAAQPRLFSPNGDGRLDTTSVLFSLGAAATANLQIQDAGGAVVRSLLANVPLPQGASAAAWDGTTDAGQPAPDGDYTVVLAVQAAANSSFTDKQSITVTLDRTPPTVTITRPLPGGYVAPIGGVTGTITDAHLVSWSVSLTSTPQAPVWTQIATGTANVTAATLASLAGLAEGSYALKVDAADAGQIQVEQIIPFTVDATPPKVTLTAPAAGAILGSVGGLVTVAGSVVEDHLQDWRVELGAGQAPASWTALATGTSLPVPTPALAWNVGAVTDGDYTLRLIADELTGQTGEARVAVTIDNTPPVVAILSPADGGAVTGPVDIVGTATDPHLVEYRLAVAPGPKATATLFSNLGAGSISVQSGRLLAWTALPPDGVVTLRLTAVDRAGNQSAAYAQLTVHTKAPAAPQGLTAQVDHRDVHLAWLANAETDLAGYRVWRNGAVVTTQPVTGTSYVDAGLAEGTYTYTVTAVDRYGLESVPSAPATATIDLTAPTALISRPRGGSRTGGVVDVIGTAYKQNDFKEYRVFATPADGSGPRQLLRRSPVPVQAALLVQWSTLSLRDGSAFVLRLEAEDLAGNVAAAEVTVTVDNTPPAAPTGLTATPDGTTIHLVWNANSESDLAGYLLYRNGKVANAIGPVVGDLTPYLLTSPAYDDLSLPDGTFVYVVYAVDQAGNQSPPSAPAQASLDNHPPHVVITQPAAGALFQDSLDIVGTTPDLDVVNVQFQWQPAGAAGWNNLGAALTAPPWEVIWSTTAIAYGDYMIRAVATDAGGRTDPAPAAVPVTRKNLAKPPAPTGLAARVAGGTVTLTWTAGTPAPPDLAGYLVDRTGADGTVTHLTASPIAATTYVDAGLADGSYSYAVTAVNQAGNASAPAGPQSAVVYSLALTQPYTPTSATATDLAGTGAAAGSQVAGTTTGPGGSTPISPVAADGGGNFAFTALPLARGDNQLAVSASDAAGNTSKSASVPVLTADPPAQPTGVTAAAGSDNVVQLAWNANPAADNVRGYRLTRDGNPQPAPALVDGPVTASSSGATPNGPANAVDGNPATYWAPVAGSDPDLRHQWLELDWPNAEQVARFEIDWGGETQADGSTLIHNAGDYLLEGWDGRVWVPLARRSGDAAAATRIVPVLPYLTNRVRLQLLPSSALPWVAEMRVYQYPLTAGTTASDAPGGGSHSYQVIAVGPLGIESQPSAAATATVGTPPAAVTLSGTANGSEVDLRWTASTSPNIAYYLVFREGAQIAQVTNPATLAYADAGRPDGTWHYTVEAVDQLGSVSAPSNVVAVTVTVAPPPAPTGLTVSVVPTGGALDLSWTVSPGTAAGTAFEVERGAASGGPYQVVATVQAGPYRDSGLTNGQTYYYVVVAVDGLGNASAASNEASGRPADTTPPAAPVLHFPAISTLPFHTGDDTAELTGTAEPGATVSVVAAGTGGTYTTQALAAAAVEEAAGAAFRSLPPSPDGRYLLENFDQGTVTLVDFDAAGGPATVTLPPLNPVPFGVSWMADGRGLLLVTGGEIDSYRFAGKLRAPLTTLDTVYAVTAAPDGVRLAILGSLSGQSGLWVFDPSAGGLTLLVAFDPTAVGAASLVWSPDGSYLAYVGPQPASSSGSAGLVVVQVAAPNAAFLIEASPGSGRPSFTPDGSAVAYTEALAAVGEKVRLTTLATGTAVDLTGVQPGPLLPQLSPDGKMLAYATAAGVVAGPVAPFGPSSPQPALLSSLAGDTPQDLAWVPGGYLRVAAVDGFRIAPAGRFAVPAAALALGDNSFTATARDAAGNVSGASAPRVIHRAAANLPDFAIAPADLALLPAAPLAGQAVRVSATVHNIGPADAPATTLALTAFGPGAAQVPLAAALAVPAIAAGGMATVTQDGAIPGPAGAWTLVAQVDPQGLVQQVSTANDRAQISFQVVSQGPPAVTVKTDQASYQPNATLTATVTVFNGSTTFNGQALVTIEDTQGFAVATLPAIPVDQLGYGQQLTQQATWNVGSTFAGNYLVDVKLQDGQGNTVAEATAPFAIVTVAQLTAAVTTDRSSYTVGASVHISAQVGYPTGNTPLTGVQVHLQVLGGGGPGGTPPPSVLADWVQPVGTLLPGGQGTVAVDWASGTAAAGAYQVTAAVLDGGQVAASAGTQFSLTSAAAVVSGTLSLADRAPSWGKTLGAAYTLHNGGAAALSQVPVRVRVLDAVTAQELARQAAAFDLPAGGGASGSASFDTTVLGLGNRLAVLEADLPASGGTGSGGTQTVTLAVVGFSVVDRTPPTVTVIQPAAGAVVGGSFAVQATALDPLSTVTSVQVSLDGGAWQAAAPLDPAKGSFQALSTGVAAGSHSVRAQATDAAGNSATSAPVAFTVVTAPPTITITGVQAGGLYAAAVTPVVAITAATSTFSATSTLDGQPFVSGTAVSAEGNHTLAVAVTDAVGNQASAAVSFAIDTTPPAIAITGVANGGLYGAAATPVTPVVTVTDAHPGTQTITLNGQPFVSGTAVSADGSYTLAVVATDAAGNQASATVAFTIYKTPPVIAVTGVTNGALVNATVTPVVMVTDAHPGTQTITLNGQPFVSGTAVSAEGSYTLAVSATDAAGNQASATVAFTIDKTAPAITVTGVTNGGLYNVTVTPVVTVSDAHPGTQTITLNGQPFVSGTAVSAEGSYTLVVNATDAAGNQASATVAFTIDKTPPAITVTGVANNALYKVTVTPVVTVSDAHPGTQTITLNGQPFNSGTAVSAEGSYTLVVHATDAAGNQASATVAFTIDKTPPVITVTGVTNGATYTAAVTPVVTVTDAHPGTQTITLNGQPFVSGTSVAAAGSYQLQVTAVDAAGNQAQAAVSFTIGAATPSLSVADVTVTSPGAGSTAAPFPVTLSAPASGTVSVVYSTAPGTAVVGTDYIPVGGTLSFAPGTTQQTVSVPVLADPPLQSDATFTLHLAQPQGATLSRATATGNILPATACTSVNLLANPGAELPTVSNLIPGWDVVAGTAWQVAGGPPPPFDGDADLATSDPAGELRQDVDVLAYAAQIAAGGGQSFAFTGELRTANGGGGAPASTARIVVEYRDAANQTVLGSYDSGPVSSTQAWVQAADQRVAPAGTRWIRVRLLSGLPAAAGAVAYFDGLSLTSVKDPTLAALDAAAATPAAGKKVNLVVRVLLSCAAPQTVSVHYATVDDTAVAGKDYQAASGSLSFPPGIVEQDVPLVGLGLAGDQVDRIFDLALTQPAGAAVARAEAVVRLLPAPFCAQPPVYWRHHLDSWTLASVPVGGVTYTQGGSLWLLGYGGSDPLALLAQQTAATRLDLAAGGSPAGQSSAANADAFLAQHPLGTTLTGSDPQTAANLTAALTGYDSGSCPLLCSAEPLGVVGRFNLFALGNVTQSGTDTAGRLAAAGNVTLSNYSVGQSLTATGGDDDVLIAGGALSFTGGTVSHGNVVYGGTVGLTSVSLPNGTARQDAPIDFAGASRSLIILSSYWASLAANGTTTVQPWKQIQLAGNNNTLNVFNVHGSDLAVAVGLSIQVPAGSTALINVDGTSDQMQNFGFQLTGVANGQVILNFSQATTLKISGIGVPGTVMAPRAAVNFSNGNVNGTLIAASMSGGGQFNQYLFTGCLPVGH